MVYLSKKGFVKIIHYHLVRDIKNVGNQTGDLLIVSDLNEVEKTNANHINLQRTYVFNLYNYASIDEIKKQMCSTIRNNVNYCINNNVSVEFFKENIDRHILKDFLKTLKGMYKQKRLKSKLPSINTLTKYSNCNSLIVSRTMYNELPVSYHVYLADSIECVLWFSCSLFRGSTNSIDKNFVGKCNRYHHFEDICYFYQKNYLSYDWGGVSSFDNPNGIDLFKYSFPGVKITKYELMIPLTWKGSLYLRLKGYSAKK